MQRVVSTRIALLIFFNVRGRCVRRQEVRLNKHASLHFYAREMPRNSAGRSLKTDMLSQIPRLFLPHIPTVVKSPNFIAYLTFWIGDMRGSVGDIMTVRSSRACVRGFLKIVPEYRFSDFYRQTLCRLLHIFFDFRLSTFDCLRRAENFKSVWLGLHGAAWAGWDPKNSASKACQPPRPR